MRSAGRPALRKKMRVRSRAFVAIGAQPRSLRCAGSRAAFTVSRTLPAAGRLLLADRNKMQLRLENRHGWRILARNNRHGIVWLLSRYDDDARKRGRPVNTRFRNGGREPLRSRHSHRREQVSHPNRFDYVGRHRFSRRPPLQAAKIHCWPPRQVRGGHRFDLRRRLSPRWKLAHKCREHRKSN